MHWNLIVSVEISPSTPLKKMHSSDLLSNLHFP